MWNWLGAWWGGVGLWLTQLAFPLQFAIVMIVVLPVCLGVAWLIDRAVDLASARLSRTRTAAPVDGRKIESGR
ncbi:MAG: hypothetical protein ACRDRN_07600 [Sciscionella sp.]